MELNAEQIKKALERCANEWHCGLCGFTEKECALIKKSTLAIITSQEQKIKELTEENERLSQSLANSESILANAKAETVRKMQSEIEARCIKGGIYPAFVARVVDEVVKEMLEERNDTR